MLRDSKDFSGCTIRATDGEIGRVTTLFFDDERWAVRYVVVDTASWFLGREVLISPISITQTNWDDRALEVALTREQVKGSPDIDAHRPVSRQQEMVYASYYGYPYYWVGPGLWGVAANPGRAVEAHRVMLGAQPAARHDATDDPHLRSTDEVSGYHVEATDGDIGHIERFLFDDEDWAIRYIVVDTSNWWGGRRVLIAPSWIRGVRWMDSKVSINMTRDAVKRSPEYDPAAQVNREYEDRLYSHYGAEPYWSNADDRHDAAGSAVRAERRAR